MTRIPYGKFVALILLSLVICIVPLTTWAQATNTGTTAPDCSSVPPSPSPVCPAGCIAKVVQDPGSPTFSTNQVCVALTANPLTTNPSGQPLEICGLSHWSFTDCIWNPLLSWLGSWFLTIGGALLVLSGALFDTLVQYVLIGFGSTINTLQIMPAINTGWTVFRDFSNIFIIGIFVFIAISIILGLKEFGQKRMIAKVLIIAVLINFSLLFTKMIIDASNFTASVIYTQMAGVPASGSTAASFDIAQSFLRPIGITSVWSDSKVLTDGVVTTTGSGIQAFMFGLIGGLLLLAIALVLFYGCFLIAARAVLLIFVMLTSAIAFATYLVPGFAKSTYGWSGWWKTLINAAVFAPLVMLFLSISLAMLTAAGSVAKTPIGTIISNPQTALSGNAWITILLYIICIGTLFVSFRLSSSFAGKISGLNIASAFVASPFTLANRFGVAPLLRQLPVPFGGRASQARALGLGADIDRQKLELANLPKGTAEYNKKLKEMQSTVRSKQRAESRAKSSFNVMNTAPAKAVATGLGLTGFAAGTDKKPPSFNDGAKARADQAAKAAAETAISEEDARKAALKQRTENQRYREEKETREATKRAAEENLVATKATAEKGMAPEGEPPLAEQLQGAKTQQAKAEQHDQIGKELETAIKAALSQKPDLRNNLNNDNQYKEAGTALKEAEASKKTKTDTHAEAMKQLQGQFDRATTDEQRKEIAKQLFESEESHKSDLRHENENIENARKTVQSAEERVTAGDEVVAKVLARRAALREEIGEPTVPVQKARENTEAIQQRINLVQKPIGEAQRKVDEAEAALNSFTAAVNKDVVAMTKEIRNAGTENARAIAGGLTRPAWTEYLPRTIRDSLDNRTVAQMARKDTKKKTRISGIKDRIAATRELEKEGGDEGEGSASTSGGETGAAH